ncbi:MAG: 3'-5' exonuclease [Bacteroidia bacterium]
MNTLIILVLVVLVVLFIFREQKNRKQRSKLISSFSTETSKQGKQSGVQDLTLRFESSKTNQKHYFIFDCETTGLPIDRYADESNFENWPHPVQIAWMVLDEDFGLVLNKSYILKQPVKIPKKASDIHGITTERMNKEGVDPKSVYSEFINDIKDTSVSIAHNTDFDVPILKCDLLRNKFTKKVFVMKNLFCTMLSSTNICKIKNPRGGYKWPRLDELYGFLFYKNTNISIEGAHDAMNDVFITAKCYVELKRRNLV